MNLSQFETMDPQLLPGLLNTALRNDCDDLRDLLRTHDLDGMRLLRRMRKLGYHYCEDTRQFRPGSSDRGSGISDRNE